MILNELIIRTLCDTLPERRVDGAYLFAQTEDNQESVFGGAQRLLKQHRVQRIMFMCTPALCGYPGFDHWRRALLDKGIPDGLIEGVSSPDTASLNTLIEARAMVGHARRQGYNTVIVCASPFQQPRAFMTAVTVARLEYPGLNIYSQPGQTLPWQEKATHSQGRTGDSRAGLICGEFERIERYQVKGDLVPVEAVLDYMNKRL